MERTSPSSGAPRQRFPYAGSSVPPSIWTGASTPMRRRHRPKLPIWKWCLRPTTARTKVRSARPATARALAWTATRTEHGEAGAAGGGDAVDATVVKVASVTRQDRETVTTMRRRVHPNSSPSRAKISRKRRQLTTGSGEQPLDSTADRPEDSHDDRPGRRRRRGRRGGRRGRDRGPNDVAADAGDTGNPGDAEQPEIDDDQPDIAASTRPPAPPRRTGRPRRYVPLTTRMPILRQAPRFNGNPGSGMCLRLPMAPMSGRPLRLSLRSQSRRNQWPSQKPIRLGRFAGATKSAPASRASSAWSSRLGRTPPKAALPTPRRRHSAKAGGNASSAANSRLAV